jgi:hypothetical protein
MSADKYRRGPVRRQLHHRGHLVIEWLAPVASTLLRSRWMNVVRHLPYVPTRTVPRLRSPAVPWTAPVPEPLDGRHYGPGQEPHVPNSVVQPPSYQFNPARTMPVHAARD